MKFLIFVFSFLFAAAARAEQYKIFMLSHGISAPGCGRPVPRSVPDFTGTITEFEENGRLKATLSATVIFKDQFRPISPACGPDNTNSISNISFSDEMTVSEQNGIKRFRGTGQFTGNQSIVGSGANKSRSVNGPVEINLNSGHTVGTSLAWTLPPETTLGATRPEFSYTIGAILIPLGKGPTGDTNFDCKVDMVDLNNVRNNFGKTGGSVIGDVDFDGQVGISDLNVVRNKFGLNPCQ